MRTKQVTEAHIDDFKLGYWSEEDQEWYPLEGMDKKEVSDVLKCSVELVDFMQGNFEDLVEQLKLDLTDIWEVING